MTDTLCNAVEKLTGARNGHPPPCSAAFTNFARGQREDVGATVRERFELAAVRQRDALIWEL
jgi:hypothetical protein